jgi:hypothetical protein
VGERGREIIRGLLHDDAPRWSGKLALGRTTGRTSRWGAHGDGSRAAPWPEAAVVDVVPMAEGNGGGRGGLMVVAPGSRVESGAVLVRSSVRGRRRLSVAEDGRKRWGDHGKRSRCRGRRSPSRWPMSSRGGALLGEEEATCSGGSGGAWARGPR